MLAETPRLEALGGGGGGSMGERRSSENGPSRAELLYDHLAAECAANNGVPVSERQKLGPRESEKYSHRGRVDTQQPDKITLACGRRAFEPFMESLPCMLFLLPHQRSSCHVLYACVSRGPGVGCISSSSSFTQNKLLTRTTPHVIDAGRTDASRAEQILQYPLRTL